MKKAQIDEILYSNDDEKNSDREQTLREKFWLKLRETANRIPFMDDVAAAYYCALDPQTPNKVRGILLAALAYFILPLDTIPDFLVGFGLTDDITVLTVAFTAISGHIKDSSLTTVLFVKRNNLKSGRSIGLTLMAGVRTK